MTKSMLDIANKNCHQLMALIDDILDIEKIATGKMGANMETLNVFSMIEESIELNQNLSEQYGVVFNNTTDKKCPKEILVNGDRQRLMQVLSNLMSNAAKFSPKGEEIDLFIIPNDETVRIAVKDRGIGVPVEYKKSIFEKFTQIDSSDTRQVGGSGLGLSISQAIVKHHGGEIEFESEVGIGSTFFFSLPLLR